MDFAEHNFEHLTQVEDHREGALVCSNCGLVVSSLFLNQISNLSQLETDTYDFILKEIQDVLDRIHIPVCYAPHIRYYFIKNYKQKTPQAISFSIFKVLNDQGISISMKEISQATQIPKKTLSKAQNLNQFVSINYSEVMEKYVKALNLTFETITVIKEKINNAPQTGHNPNSIIASIIYQICKQRKIKTSIKKISEVTHVSSISIQRYNNFCKKLS